jgi:D-alanine-D-alanine ligase
MNVLVVLGGVSAERSISLKSGTNVIKALKNAGHHVSTFDPKLDSDILDYLKGIDVVFPVLHGKGGEDGEIQRQLESLKVNFVGSDSISSQNCFDKYKTMRLLPDVLFPKTELLDYEEYCKSPMISRPFVLKPTNEGSSIDTFIVRNPKEYSPKVMKDVFERHNKMIVQELIEGIELTVPVLIDKALPVIEIIPPVGKEFDYENKYNGATKEIVPPINLSLIVQKNAQEIAQHVHKSMGCRSFSRTDFICTNNQELYCLEVNTLPGMTAESLFPKSAKAAGISIENLVDILVND